MTGGCPPTGAVRGRGSASHGAQLAVFPSRSPTEPDGARGAMRCYLAVLAPLSCTAAEPERTHASARASTRPARGHMHMCSGRALLPRRPRPRSSQQAQALARHVSEETAFMACDIDTDMLCYLGLGAFSTWLARPCSRSRSADDPETVKARWRRRRRSRRASTGSRSFLRFRGLKEAARRGRWVRSRPRPEPEAPEPCVVEVAVVLGLCCCCRAVLVPLGLDAW